MGWVSLSWYYNGTKCDSFVPNHADAIISIITVGPDEYIQI